MKKDLISILKTVKSSKPKWIRVGEVKAIYTMLNPITQLIIYKNMHLPTPSYFIRIKNEQDDKKSLNVVVINSSQSYSEVDSIFESNFPNAESLD